MIWDKEMSQRLAALWKTHSSGQIVAIFAADGYDVTRCSIMGRVRRMGMIRTKKDVIHPNTCKRFAPQQPQIKRNKSGIGAVVQAINRRSKSGDAPPVDAERFTPLTCETDSRQKTLLELRAGECRWPDENRNSDGLHTFCGQPAESGPYCPAHRKLSRGEGTPSERAASKVLERAAA